VAQLFSLGHERFWILLCWFGWRRFGQFDSDEQDFGSSFELARAGSRGEQVRQLVIDERWDLPDFIMSYHDFVA
jgi:hypothetical protein